MLDRPSKNDASTQVPAPGIAPMLNAFNPMTAYVAFWGGPAIQLGGEAAQSWLHFLGSRLTKDMRFPQQIADCKTAEDVATAFAEFWQQASKDYSSEFNQLANLTWTATRTAFDGAGTFTAKDCGCSGKCASQKAGTA
ncbi:MAG: hypothetical protein JSR78_11825 [Proteobacteria bacterium]|nr:hypothetical protein [Pseudomonadota bacterium]